MSAWLSSLAVSAMGAVGHTSGEALAALFLVTLLTEAGIPFPLLVDTVLFLLGYQLGQFWIQALSTVLALFLGRQSGSALVYWSSHLLGRPVVVWFMKHFPWLRAVGVRLVRLPGIRTYLAVAVSRVGGQAPLAVSLSRAGARSSFTLAVARLTPGLLTATSLASGAIRLDYRYFALGVGVASIVEEMLTLALGFLMGYGLLRLGLTPSPWLILVGLVVDIAIIWAVPRLIWRNRRPRSN